LSFKIGEVIEASTGQFTAQCYELHQPAAFGSLVTTREGEVDIYGVVSAAMTTSLEPGRRPIARGAEEVDEEAVYQSSPQLAKLLRTDFTSISRARNWPSCCAPISTLWLSGTAATTGFTTICRRVRPESTPSSMCARPRRWRHSPSRWISSAYWSTCSGRLRS